jgi:molecular chaperone GrpE (heat shock protein)
MAKSKKEAVVDGEDNGVMEEDTLEQVTDDDESTEKVEDTENGSDLRSVMEELGGLKEDFALSSERLEALAETAAQLDGISGDVKELLRFRGLITGVVGKLYEQIEEKKADTRHKALKPFLKDLILFYDDLGEVQIETAEELGEEHRAAKALTMLTDSVLEILYRADVEPYQGEGDSLDITTQKTVEIREVTDLEKNMRVLEVLSTGFVGPEGVLRREQVVVGKYVAGEEEDSEEGEKSG